MSCINTNFDIESVNVKIVLSILKYNNIII